MPKFRICFRVEQTLAGNIDVEAESAEAAQQMFHDALDGKNEYVDALREDADLDLDDSQDSIVDITNLETGERTECDE